MTRLLGKPDANKKRQPFAPIGSKAAATKPKQSKKNNAREEFFQAERLWSPAQRSDDWRAKETQPVNAAKRLPLLRFPARRCAATSESPSGTEPGAKNGKILLAPEATFQKKVPP
ncbi:hypothetical protein P9G84_13425 [Brevibacillus centrosporus]|uniref:hypothetical protein n=1 Tax=Brevibacillus centrosporus TaxID=54910 RepID=UPI001606ADA2|nr:hypothetical protein [Brevibacillus centrosporus]MEC2129963.1 hypothetical protein [Brevibacillus centrosporus]